MPSFVIFFFFSSRRLHTNWPRDWSSDVCSSDLQRPDRLAVLDGLDVPALVLYGADDAITGQDDHEAMGSTLGTEPVRVPEAGHLAAVEQPRQVASALTRLHEAALARSEEHTSELQSRG